MSPNWLKDMKEALRVSGSDLDTEIEDLIAAARADLKLSGVIQSKLEAGDSLIKRAVILYCRANFGYEDPKYAERFQDSYASLKTHLTLSQEYTQESDNSE